MTLSRITRTGRQRRNGCKTDVATEDALDASNRAVSLHAKGRQGEVHFFLQRVSGGLYVEREQIPGRGLRTLQSVHFIDAVAFNRWCDNDPVRFEHPVLHVSLKRDGDELWRIEPKPADR